MKKLKLPIFLLGQEKHIRNLRNSLSLKEIRTLEQFSTDNPNSKAVEALNSLVMNLGVIRSIILRRDISWLLPVLAQDSLRQFEYLPEDILMVLYTRREALQETIANMRLLSSIGHFIDYNLRPFMHSRSEKSTLILGIAILMENLDTSRREIAEDYYINILSYVKKVICKETKALFCSHRPNSQAENANSDILARTALQGLLKFSDYTSDTTRRTPHEMMDFISDIRKQTESRCYPDSERLGWDLLILRMINSCLHAWISSSERSDQAGADALYELGSTIYKGLKVTELNNERRLYSKAPLPTLLGFRSIENFFIESPLF